MTRLLLPEAFGLMAMVAAINFVALLLSDIGIRQAVVQSVRGDEATMLDTAWTLQIARGFIVWCGCSLVAVGLYVARTSGALPPDSVYGAPALPALLAAATFSSVVAGFASTKLYTADRQLQQGRVAIIEIISQSVGLLLMGVAAWATQSVWALVVGGWASVTVSVVLSHAWLPGVSNRLQWDAACAREIILFGRWILLSSLLWGLAANGDRLMLGAWVNPTVLGQYAIAATLAMMVEAAAGRIFGAVATPAFSDVVRRDPRRLREVYLRMRVSFDFAFVGAAGLLFSTGQWIVDLLYDARYAPAGAILQILSFSLVFTRYGLVASAYLAVGAPKYLTAIHFVKVVSLFVSVPAAYSLAGNQGAYWAVALHLLPTLPLIAWFNSRHGLNSWFPEAVAAIAWPVGYGTGLLFLQFLAWLR